MRVVVVAVVVVDGSGGGMAGNPYPPPPPHPRAPPLAIPVVVGHRRHGRPILVEAAGLA